MKLEKDAETRLRDWLIKIAGEKDGLKKNLTRLSEEIKDLKSDHELENDKLELLNDIDDKTKRDTANSVFHGDIEARLDQLRIAIEAKISEKEYTANKIEAIDTLIASSGLFGE